VGHHAPVAPDHPERQGLQRLCGTRRPGPARLLTTWSRTVDHAPDRAAHPSAVGEPSSTSAVLTNSKSAPPRSTISCHDKGSLSTPLAATSH
jgi:hypothetical protein